MACMSMSTNATGAFGAIRTAMLAGAAVLACAGSAVARGGFEPPTSIPIAGCGEIVYDELCTQLFQLDGGGLYSFSGVDGLEIGERVFVAGDVCLICLLTPCGSPYSAILGAIVASCDDGGGTAVSGCMSVEVDAECGPLLVDDEGTRYHADGWITAEQVGLRFFVEGEISALFTVPCPGPPVPEQLPFFITLTLGGCTGDLDFDGAVGGADLGLLLNAWGSSCLVQDPCLADLNGDLQVDGADLGLLVAAWG